MYGLPRIQDLPAAEIARLLAKQGQQVPPALAADLQVFIDEISGSENGFDTVELLGELEAAA
jgi:hypothetical protein